MPPESRRDLFRRAAGGTRTVIVSTGRDRFAISTRDEVGEALFENGELAEWRTLATALEVLDSLGIGEAARERHFVDLGAGIGTLAVRAVREHGFKAALALEPIPETYKLLVLNVILNDLQDDVRYRRTALSDELTLDDLATSEGRLADDLGLIWMDVGGQEGHVLSGAQRTLSTGVPCVLKYSAEMLGVAGGLERLELQVQRQYDWFVDLRSLTKPPADQSRLRGVEHFSELPGRYRSGETDVLLVSRRWHEPVL